VPDLRVLVILLGDEPAVDPALPVYQRLLVGDGNEAAELVEAQLEPHGARVAYEEVLLGALAYARREHAAERIADDDRARFVAGFHTMLDRIGAPMVPPAPGAPHVVACPLRDDLDVLGFALLQQLLDPAVWRLELASPEMLSSEVVALIAGRAPAVVCLGSVGAGGLAQTRYLTRRLRGALPDARILVARWGNGPLAPEEVASLRQAGASEVGTTLGETREQLTRVTPARAESAAA
jgi:hypothetical protein